MRKFIDIVEAPIRDIGYHGDMSSFGSLDLYGDIDDGYKPEMGTKRMVQSPAYQHAVKRFFKNCPHDINLHFINSNTAHHDVEILAPPSVKARYGVEVPFKKGSVNIIVTHNLGTDAVKMSPWIIAHRLSHMLISKYTHGKIWEEVFDNFRMISYRLFPRCSMNPATALATVIGTTKACREGRLVQWGEWWHDSFAQWILTGDVKVKSVREVSFPVKTQDDQIELLPEPRITSSNADAFIKKDIEKMKATFSDMMESAAKRNAFVVL